MINSLFKDSHINQPLCHPLKRHTQDSTMSRSAFIERSNDKCERREYFCATVNNDQGITANKPAEISFSGLSNAKMANEPCIETIIKQAKASFSEKIDHKKIVDFISKSVEHVTGANKSTDSNIIDFSKKNNQNIKSIINKATELLKDENKKEPLTAAQLEKETQNTIKFAVEAYPTIQKHKSIFKNERVRRFLKMAAHSQAVFNAVFALGLTCILRPAAIMALPADKKNADDKKYAAAHSIAAGLIGYAFSFVVFAPISDAMRKIEFSLNDQKNPSKKHFQEIKSFASAKNPHGLDYLKNGKLLNNAKTWVNMLPETILAAPRAVVTIALIPPILKYIFGWEKKKSDSKEETSPILQNYALLNFKSTNIPQKKVFQNFSGGAKS